MTYRIYISVRDIVIFILLTLFLTKIPYKMSGPNVYVASFRLSQLHLPNIKHTSSRKSKIGNSSADIKAEFILSVCLKSYTTHDKLKYNSLPTYHIHLTTSIL